MTMIKVKHKMIFEEVIQVQTDGIVCNGCTSQSVTSEAINEMVDRNQSKILKQTEVEIDL